MFLDPTASFTSCLDRPTSGEYHLRDENVATMDDDELSEVRSKYLGFIFQSYNLLAQYTVVENIEIPLIYQGCRMNDETRRLVDHDHVIVFVNDFQRNRLGLRARGKRRRYVNLDGSAGIDAMAGIADRMTVDLDRAGLDQHFKTRAGQVSEMAGQHAI